MALVESSLDGGVLTVTLNDEERRNALSRDLLVELVDILDGADADDAVRVVVLTNAGTTFCAGANLREQSSPTSGGRTVDMAEVFARHRTSIPVIGHAGDGNFHPLVTYDAADADATARAHAAFDEVMASALELGGTVSGEHGIGVLKARHLRAQLGDDVMELTRRIKGALDPDGIFNPGKWV